jgi:hypothetical protein
MMITGTRVSNSPSFNDVLKTVMASGFDGALMDKDTRHDRWNKSLRDFFKRWLDNQTDGELWEVIASDVEKDGLSRETCFYRIASSAIWARFDGYPANAKNVSLKQLKLWRNKLLELARYSQSLADHHRNQLRFGPDQRTEDAARFYEHEAENFRLSVQKTGAEIEAPRPDRYQSHGRKFTHEHLSFMRSLVTSMRSNFGKPHYEAAAAITNIAYQREDVITAEDVRTACRKLPPVDRQPIYSDEEAAAIGKSMLDALDVAGRKRSGKLDAK